MILTPPTGNIAKTLLLPGCLALSTLASAQDFSLNVAGANRMLENGILPDDLGAIFDPTLGGTLKGTVGYGLSVGASYDSNIYLTSSNEQDEVIFSLSPSVFYSSDPEGGATYSLTAYYSPSLQVYLDNSSLGGVNHSGGASFELQGGKTSIRSFVSVQQGSGSDRFTETYSEGTVFSGGVSANYQVAPRTSVWASFTAAGSSYSTGNQQGSDVYSTRLGANWSATERLKFGPSIDYTVTKSDNTGTITGIGPSFNLNYVATERLNLNGSVGFQWTEYERSSSENGIRPTGSLGFGYLINDRWSWSGSIQYSSIPSANQFNTVKNDFSMQTAVSRALLRGSVSGGLGYSFTQSEQIGLIAGPSGDDDYISAFVRYSRPLFSERISFSTTATYSQSSGFNEWSKWLLSVGLSTQF